MSDGLRQSCTWRMRRTHGELLPHPGIGQVPVGWQGSMTVARSRIGSPPSARAACQELSPLTSWQSPRAPAEAMGMAAGPGSAQPDARKNLIRKSG